MNTTWQFEEQEKREKAEAELLAEQTIAKEQITKLWEKFLELNNQLIPSLKLTIQKRDFGFILGYDDPGYHSYRDLIAITIYTDELLSKPGNESCMQICGDYPIRYRDNLKMFEIQNNDYHSMFFKLDDQVLIEEFFRLIICNPRGISDLIKSKWQEAKSIEAPESPGLTLYLPQEPVSLWESFKNMMNDFFNFFK
ncbi:MAG: hypothetical protein WCW02_02715 [Candidatus Buchananbacteria bacterium]